VEKRSLSYGVKAAPDPIEESAVNREYFPAGYFVRTQPRRLTDEDAVPELQVTPTFDARGSLDPRRSPTPRSRRDRLAPNGCETRRFNVRLPLVILAAGVLNALEAAGFEVCCLLI